MTYYLNKKFIAMSFCAILIFSVCSVGVTISPAVSVPGTYDFNDTTNNKAYGGSNGTRPLPALTGSGENAFDNYPNLYGYIANLDNIVAETYGDYSDYQRFAFKICEPVSNIASLFVEHVGYGNFYWDYNLNPGLTLYIWDNSISQWVYVNDHNNGTGNVAINGTFTSNIGNYINSSGYVNLLAQAKESLSSCPLLYTFNGEKYTFVTDMFNRGMLSLSVKSMQPEDYAKIEEDQLLQTDDLYKLQITQEYDEISFLDKVTLMMIDHPSNIDVFPSFLKELGKIYTVSKDPSTPLSAFDANGNDVLKQISVKDGQFTIAEQYDLNYVDLNLGDLSGANNIKLVLTTYTNWDNSEVLTSNATNRHGGFVQVKNSTGDWVTVYSKEMTTPSALPRTYVLNMTGKFLTNDYSVRIAYYPDVRFDYIGIDTSPEVAFTVTSLAPNYADLHFRGYSAMSGSPSIPDYYNFGFSPIEGYSDPSGNFTRYGDVLPLIMNRDDKFVVMHHGDEISASFAYIPPEEGLERDFLLYSYGYYKGSPYPAGDTVDPLPFYGMTRYPYNSTENYPSDADHLAYLQEYNTRVYSGSNPELPQHGTIYTDYVMVQVTPTYNVALVPDSTFDFSTPGDCYQGMLPLGDVAFANYNFTALPWANLTAGTLAKFDIVVLCIDYLAPSPLVTPQQANDINAWIFNGGKLIIYDSEMPPQNYDWLIYPFNTTNPGAMGESGSIVQMEDNTLGEDNDPLNIFYYINTTVGLGNDWADAIGDSNIFTTFDPNWCGDIEATNGEPVTGWVHAYARYNDGLIIYNGFDLDPIYYPGNGNSTVPSSTNYDALAKIWLLELAQPWGSCYNLPCGAPIAGNPEIAVTKVANVTQAYENEIIYYTFNISNIGDVPLYNVTLIDDLLGDLTSHISNRTIGVGEYRTFDYPVVYVYPGEWRNNTVTAIGVSAPGVPTNATASNSIEVIHPSILITKTASEHNVAVHSTIYYTFNVTNTGDTPLTNVGVIDDVLGDLTGHLPDTTLAVGESNVFVVQLTLDTHGWHNNTVTATGYDGKGTAWTNQASESVTAIIPVGGVVLPLASIGIDLMAILLSIAVVALLLYKGVFLPKGRR